MKARMPAGFGRPDMNALMRQAQKMQEDMKAKQAELEAAAVHLICYFCTVFCRRKEKR